VSEGDVGLALTQRGALAPRYLTTRRADYSQDTERIARHHIQRLGQLGYEVTVTPKEAA